MIELFAENWQNFVHYFIYVSFFVTVLLTFSLLWFELYAKKNYQYQVNQVYSTPRKLVYFYNCDSVVQLLVWLPKTIRRKESMGEDPDGPIFLSAIPTL
jgi:hypothetical protein